MRFFAILPTLLALGAAILTILCIFAGSKPGFLEGYSIIALNTSRIGQNIVQKVVNETNRRPELFLSKFDPTKDNRWAATLASLAKPLANRINNMAGKVVTSLADEFGVDDFYSMHLLTYCEGNFYPTALPNATYKISDIKRNVTYCSDRNTMFEFNPKAALEQSLNKSGTGVTLKDLGWPEEIDDGINALMTALHATFGLYCAGTALAFLAVLAGLWWLVGSGGRTSVLLELGLGALAFLALLIASTIVTVVGVKGDKVIDKYGAKIGIEAVRGNGYLGLTWSATVLMFLVTLLAVFGLVLGRRRQAKTIREK